MQIPRSEGEKSFLKRAGRYLAELRREQRYTQQHVAEALGYKKSVSINQIETGYVKSLDLILLQRYAQFLGLDFENLVSDVIKHSKDS